MLEDKIQNRGMFLFKFSHGSNAMDQKSGDGRFSGRSKIIVPKGNTHVPNSEMPDARIASAVNKIIQNSHFEEKVSLEEQRAQKEDRFLRGRQIAYMIYDYFRVTAMTPFLITLISSQWLFATTIFRNSRREGTNIYYRRKIPTG